MAMLWRMLTHSLVNLYNKGNYEVDIFQRLNVCPLLGGFLRMLRREALFVCRD